MSTTTTSYASTDKNFNTGWERFGLSIKHPTSNGYGPIGLGPNMIITSMGFNPMY